MPPIFKALISITVWILFVKGCLGILAGTITVAMAGGTPPLAGVAECGVGVVALVLAAVAAWIRQKLE